MSIFLYIIASLRVIISDLLINLRAFLKLVSSTPKKFRLFSLVSVLVLVFKLCEFSLITFLVILLLSNSLREFKSFTSKFG